MAQQENPIVFISYSQDSLSFADQVLSFANKLRSEGIDAILDQYEATVKPMYEAFVEPSKRYADVIIPRGGENTIGITMLKEYLKHLLAK